MATGAAKGFIAFRAGKKLEMWQDNLLFFSRWEVLILLLTGTLYGCVGHSPRDSFANGLDIQEMPQDLPFPHEATLQRDSHRGTIRFLKGPNLSMELEKETGYQTLQAENRFGEMGLAFLHVYRSQVKLEHPLQELVVYSIKSDDLGYTHVRLQQIFADIPVWGAEILVHLDQDKHVYLVTGRYVPTPSQVKTTPQLTADAAKAIVASHLKKPQSSCPACSSTLIFFINEAHEPRLAYRVLASVSLIEGWAITVDAETGAILQKEPTVYSNS